MTIITAATTANSSVPIYSVPACSDVLSALFFHNPVGKEVGNEGPFSQSSLVGGLRIQD